MVIISGRNLIILGTVLTQEGSLDLHPYTLDVPGCHEVRVIDNRPNT